MTENYFYNTIEKPSIAEFKDRGSKFIAFAYPLSTKDNCKEKLLLVKAHHPKASHYCFAYRLGTTGSEFRVSDDGEPSGTAGRPILGQIDCRELTNILIIVIRYFGGSLLGTPGLINAYKTSASLALQIVPIVKKAILVRYILAFNYAILNEIMLLVKQYQCIILSQDLQLFCSMIIDIPKNNVEVFEIRMKEIRSLDWKRQE